MPGTKWPTDWYLSTARGLGTSAHAQWAIKLQSGWRWWIMKASERLWKYLGCHSIYSPSVTICDMFWCGRAADVVLTLPSVYLPVQWLAAIWSARVEHINSMQMSLISATSTHNVLCVFCMHHIAPGYTVHASACYWSFDHYSCSRSSTALHSPPQPLQPSTGFFA